MKIILKYMLSFLAAISLTTFMSCIKDIEHTEIVNNIFVGDWHFAKEGSNRVTLDIDAIYSDNAQLTETEKAELLQNMENALNSYLNSVPASPTRSYNIKSVPEATAFYGDYQVKPSQNESAINGKYNISAASIIFKADTDSTRTSFINSTRDTITCYINNIDNAFKATEDVVSKITYLINSDKVEHYTKK